MTIERARQLLELARPLASVVPAFGIDDRGGMTCNSLTAWRW
jgi:hypothetical protein